MIQSYGPYSPSRQEYEEAIAWLTRQMRLSCLAAALAHGWPPINQAC